MALQIITNHEAIKRALLEFVGTATGIRVGQPQIDTVTIDAAEDNVKYTITVNSVSIDFTSDATATIAEIQVGLIAAANASTAFSALVDTVPNGADMIRLTAVKLGGQISTAVADDGTGTAMSFALTATATPGRVAWLEDDFARPAIPDDADAYATVKLNSRGQTFGLDQVDGKFEGAGPTFTQRTAGYRQASMSVNVYTQPSDTLDVRNAMDRLEDLTTMMSVPAVFEALAAANVSLLDHEPIRDLSTLVGERWETRGQVDIIVLYAVGTEDDTAGWVDTVDGVTQADGTLVVNE